MTEEDDLAETREQDTTEEWLLMEKSKYEDKSRQRFALRLILQSLRC